MNVKKSKYKAVIFDFDDTLVKSHILKWAHHKAAGKKFYNIDISDEDLSREWGKPFHNMVKNLYGDVGSVEDIVNNIRSIDKDFLKEVQEGAPTVITELLDYGIEVGIVSAADREYVKMDLLRLGFPEERFFMVQGCDDTDVHKPDPRVFDPVFKRLYELGIKQNEIVYIGDSLYDAQAAERANIDFIGIDTGVHKAHILSEAKAKVVLSNIRELLEHVFR